MKHIDQIIMAFVAVSLVFLTAVVNRQFTIIDDLRADLRAMEAECAK